MESERVIAGIRCGEVLADLSDYLDGVVKPERRAQIEAHLRGCGVCERFGGEFGAALSSLRRALTQAEPLDPDVSSRLRDRLRRDLR